MKSIGALLKNEFGGSIVLILSIILTALIIVAVAADGVCYAAKSLELRNSTKEITEYGASMLNIDSKNILSEIQEFAVRMDTELSEFDARIPEERDAITVNTGKPFEFAFLKYFGLSRIDIKSSCTYKIYPVRSCRYVYPLAIKKHNFSIEQEIEISDIEIAGNMRYMIIDNGEETIKFLQKGIDGTLHTGDKVNVVENSLNSEKYSVAENLIMYIKHKKDLLEEKKQYLASVLILPVVEKNDTDWSILGFCAFDLSESKEVNGITKLKGKFKKVIVNEEVDETLNNFGVYGYKRVN